jgi:predicted Rdx family selenoprotein
VRAADELLKGWAPVLTSLDVKPGTHGVFDVTVDGELILSKGSLKRLPRDSELAALAEARLGPRLEWRGRH